LPAARNSIDLTIGRAAASLAWERAGSGGGRGWWRCPDGLARSSARMRTWPRLCWPRSTVSWPRWPRSARRWPPAGRV